MSGWCLGIAFFFQRFSGKFEAFLVRQLGGYCFSQRHDRRRPVTVKRATNQIAIGAQRPSPSSSVQQKPHLSEFAKSEKASIIILTSMFNCFELIIIYSSSRVRLFLIRVILLKTDSLSWSIICFYCLKAFVSFFQSL